MAEKKILRADDIPPLVACLLRQSSRCLDALERSSTWAFWQVATTTVSAGSSAIKHAVLDDELPYFRLLCTFDAVVVANG